MFTEFEGRYNALLDLITHQASLGYDGAGSAYFKNTLEQVIKGDSNVESIVFLVQPDNNKPKKEVLKLIGNKQKGEKRIFSKPIRNGNDVLGICQITVSLNNHLRRINGLMKKIIFYLTAIYFFILAFFTWIYYFYFVKKREMVIKEILEPDLSLEEEIKKYIFWEDIISALNIFSKKRKFELYEREMLNPITGIPSYYLTDAMLEKLRKEKKDDDDQYDYIFLTFLGFNQLCENYGFKKGYEFLEKLISEVHSRLMKIDENIFIGHINDTTLIVKSAIKLRKQVCESILAIFKNGEKEISEKYLFLKKDWAKTILMIFPRKELKSEDMEELEKIYSKSLFRLGKKLINNSAYLYSSGGMKKINLINEKERTSKSS